MAPELILASRSPMRRQLLEDAGIVVTCRAADIDEAALRAGLEAEGASPRDVADTLAEHKARKISPRAPEALVVGCDQVLVLGGAVLAKPESPEALRTQLARMRNRSPQLVSAAVVYKDGAPQWRAVETAELLMRNLSDAYLDGYVARNWEDVSGSVGGFRFEAEGARLFSRIDGSFHAILGLPLLSLIGYLGQCGVIET